jgi:hypothetical protein
MLRLLLPLLGSLALAGPAPAQSLAVIDEVEWASFRAHCQVLLKALETLKAPLPAETVKAAQALLEQKAPADLRQAARNVQKLLDEHCLAGVHINPQSRVKAARGARRADLTRGVPAFVLVKVHNEGGVTHALAAVSPQMITRDSKDADRWVEMGVLNAKPFANRLSGDRVEYRVLKLVARQAGRREATLAFDVGQGTQDLGFRAEVPILFRVQRPPGRGGVEP